MRAAREAGPQRPPGRWLTESLHVGRVLAPMDMRWGGAVDVRIRGQVVPELVAVSASHRAGHGGTAWLTPEQAWRLVDGMSVLLREAGC